MSMAHMFAQIGSAMGDRLVIFAETCTRKVVDCIDPYIHIEFPEFTGEPERRSEVFLDIQNYLTKYATFRARRLKADSIKGSQSLILSMADNEGVTEQFQGAKVWWYSKKRGQMSWSVSIFPRNEDPRYYRLTFHQRHRELITESYIKHVLAEGKAIASMGRKRKLFTNNPSRNLHGCSWNHVMFEHPATFDNLAMEPNKKWEIMDDLQKFAGGKDYYTRIGKAWKRGYLLHGPPGTGKSTMIVAMANFLNYDVYELELTTVKDNSELKQLLLETSSKSIIMIEDIDCSLHVTGKRKNGEKKEDNNDSDDDDNEEDDDDDDDDLAKKIVKEKRKKGSKVTLSGLLNFLDGISSACAGERIIVMTTNYIEKLDPALLRRGRMDKFIKMSYCCFEAFKILARNYWGLEDHPLYATISRLIEEIEITPADVAENLMPKSDGEDAEACLRKLIEALKGAREEARKKAEEEALLKAEKEEMEKKSNAGGEVKEGGISVKENGVIIDGGVAAEEVERKRKRRNRTLEGIAAKEVKTKSRRRN